MLTRYNAIARPSVCPSNGWIIQKRLKIGSQYIYARSIYCDRITKLSPYGSATPLVFAG